MRQRLISAAVLVPVVVLIFLAGSPWLSIGIALLAALAGYEIAQLVRRAGLPANPWLVVSAPLLAAAAFELDFGPFILGPESGALIAAAALWVVLAAVDGMRRQDPKAGFVAWSGTLLASFYAVLLTFAIGILQMDEVIRRDGADFQLLGLDRGRFWLLVLVLTVWSLDTFAYLAGKYHGRGRFMNHISPNKTWSGAVGGTIAAIVVCTVLVALAGLNPAIGLVLGATIAIAAQAGDLAESMLKRAAGAKDSGTLIPGHGGILDRVDSFLFAAPVMYSTLLLLVAAGIRPLL